MVYLALHACVVDREILVLIGSAVNVLKCGRRVRPFTHQLHSSFTHRVKNTST